MQRELTKGSGREGTAWADGVQGSRKGRRGRPGGAAVAAGLTRRVGRPSGLRPWWQSPILAARGACRARRPLERVISVTLNILCIGDVVGRPGRYVLSQSLPKLVKEREVGLVVCNAENAAGGSGLTPQLYEKFLRYGVDVLTLGDHAFKRQDLLPLFSQADRLVRPANLPASAPGRGLTIYETRAGIRVAVIALLGRLYMRMMSDDPFRTADAVLAKVPPEIKVIVVDFHAEATSEKVALGWHLDGRVSVLFGTHTHVATADEQILPQGTGYITDVGMTGPYDSVLGRRKDRVLRTLLSSVPTPFDVANDDPRLCGVLVAVDVATGRATHIERIRVDGVAPPEAGGESEP